MFKNKSLRSSVLSVLKFTIGWPISIIALFFIVRIIVPHLPTIINNLQNVNRPLLALSIVSFILYYFVRSYVWKLILKQQGHDIPLKKAAFLWEKSEFKRFVPGFIWSFIGRTSIFSELGLPTKTVLKSMLIEIQFMIIANLIISIFAIPFVIKNVITIIPYNDLTITVGILIFSLIAFSFIFSKPLHLLQRILPDFPVKTKIYILLVSLIYTFFFGLGNFLAVISIVYIKPNLIIQIIGFFTFSFIAAYLSLIAPMGLGIRESIIIIGLSKILPIFTSGFISIFTRIVLIFSELTFFMTAFLWKSIKNKYFFAFENFVSNHKQEVLLTILMLIYIGYFTIASFLRFDNFYAGRFDLGNMDQTVWNTVHGRIFELTDPNGTNIISRLAIHADFILILLSPFYLLWESPKMLLLIQTVVLALGAVFVYLLAKDILKNKNLSLVFGAIYLFNPSINYTNLYDFHPVTLATTFLLASFYFLLKRKYLPLIIFLILSGLTKEHVWLIVALFGIYIFFSKVNLKKRVLGIIIFAVSIFLFYLLLWHAIPNALGTKHFALNYYSDFGDSPTKIIKNIFLSPQKTLAVILQKDQLTYLKNLSMPVGFLPIFSPLYLIFAIPDLIINLLSNNSSLRQIYFQYTSTITPFIFISAIYALKNLKKWFDKIPASFYVAYLLSTVLIAAYLFGPLPVAKNPSLDMFTKPQIDRKVINDFLTKISPLQSIAATNNIGSHLSHRQKIYTIPVGVDKADYALFLLNDLSAQPSFRFQKDLADKIKNDPKYVEVFRNGDFVAFKKNDL